MDAMSQAAAIAGVTLALKTLLESAFKARGLEDRHLSDVLVTSMPVDRARNVHHRCQVNITLATVHADGAARNGPVGLRAGKATVNGDPSQAIDLLYLLTAYGSEDDEVGAQRVMGAAMRALQSQPVLPSIELAMLFPHTGASGTLDQVRITHAPLSREQIVAWWLAFHTPYRLSSAWHVTGVSL